MNKGHRIRAARIVESRLEQMCLRNESMVWDKQNWRNGESSMPLVFQYGMTSNQRRTSARNMQIGGRE